MASYFDHTKTDHLALLPPDIRKHGEIPTIAVLAEADVIGHHTDAPPYLNYTARHAQLNDGIVPMETVGEDVSASANVQLAVYLRGYKADADHADVDPNLKLALRRTIAEVIRWRLNQWVRDQALTSSSDGGGKSRSYADYMKDAFPPRWDRWLRPFRSDEPCWGF